MAKGGARNRSGPQPDPTSLRSERRGLVLTALPREGRPGRPPAFPLGQLQMWDEYYVGSGRDRERVKEKDESATKAFRARELAIWSDAWGTPQACVWEREPWRWQTVAEYCRLKTVVERAPAASASLVAQLHRYRDQIGLTPAGMRENGWALAKDEVTERRAEAEKRPPAKRTSSRDRLKVAGNGAGG